MKRKFLSLVLASAMSVTMLAGCGNKANDGGAGNSSQKEGKIINIYSWNDEFRQRLEAVYPQVESTSKDRQSQNLRMAVRFTGLSIQTRMVYISRNLTRHLEDRLMHQQTIKLIFSFRRQIMYLNIRIKMRMLQCL